MKEVTLDWEALSGMERKRRAQLVNSISGVKPANLLGTEGPDGTPNCAIISSVVHLGSDPALLGHVMRPPVDRERGSHSYHNLKETGQYTLNHVSTAWYQRAHQTSARYPDGTSEFEAVGLTPLFRCGFEAPAVAESPVRMGLELQEELALPNGCKFIIGALRWVEFAEELWADDGAVDLARAEVAAITGLDGYHGLRPIARLSYAKPDQSLAESPDFQRAPTAPKQP